MGRWALAVALAALVALVASACGGGGSPSGAGTGNRFANPSFEDGRDPWFSLEAGVWGPPFAVSDAQAHDGAQSALLQLRSDGGGSVRVFGVVQEVTPQLFPGVLSGYYYVAGWQQGTPNQYLQAVVIVFDAANRPANVGADNYQLRYILAGVDHQPTFIGNARYVMVTTSAPKQGEWVPFRFNVGADFQRLWGSVPQGFSSLRVFFETRWDGRRPSDTASAADVFYDDLYLGSP